MKVLVTTSAQMFQTPDGNVWTNSTYGYDFFLRYLEVFDNVRLVTRMKKIDYHASDNKILVSGERLEFYPLPFYHGPWQYAKRYFSIKKVLGQAIDTCDCAVLRIPDQLSFQIFKSIESAKIPCAIEVGAHPWDFFSPGTNKTVLRPFLRVLWDVNQKKLCKHADGVLYVTKEYIQKRYPSGITDAGSNRFEAFQTPDIINQIFFIGPRSKEAFTKEVLNLVHVSGINNAAKGHYELLKTMEELKELGFNHKLTFVGGGTHLEKFKKMSIELGLGQHVDFAGNISNPKDVAEILRMADLFILPTMTEGLPRAIMEAMAAGLPCIATDVGGIPELLSARCLVKSKSVSSLRDKIVELSTDSDALEYESKYNFEKITNTYSLEVIRRKRTIFLELLKDNVRRLK